jgi:hypothetical protein
LRNQAGESLQELCDWWTAFQEQSDEQQRQMINQLNKGQGQGKKTTSAFTQEK